MNTLSWLIYAAEVAGRIGVLLGLTASALVLVAGGAWFGRGLISGSLVDSEYPSESYPQGRGDYPKWAVLRAFTERKALYCTIVVLALSSALMPSSRTIYMIAASEAGEAVVQSPEATEIMGDLKAIIKKKLKEQLAE